MTVSANVAEFIDIVIGAVEFLILVMELLAMERGLAHTAGEVILVKLVRANTNELRGHDWLQTCVT